MIHWQSNGKAEKFSRVFWWLPVLRESAILVSFGFDLRQHVDAATATRKEFFDNNFGGS
jgi:hypothetical protein